MRILQVTHYFADHPGGIERVAAKLAQGFRKKGAKVRWAASVSGAKQTSGDPNRIEISAWNGSERACGIPYPVWGPRGCLQLWRAVDDSELILVHDAHYLGSVLAATMARQLQKPLVVVQHVGAVPYPQQILRTLQSLAHASISRYVLRQADRIIFVSPKVQAHFCQRIPELQRFHVIANGVDKQLFHSASVLKRTQAKRELGVPSGPVALFVGRFVTKKGLPFLRQLCQQSPKWTWLFAGTGPIHPGNWHLPNVRCLGLLAPEQLSTLYHAADLLVLPSVGEGFPLVVQEAIACGLPALLTPDTLAGAPGYAPLVFAEGDPRRWSRLLNLLRSEPGLLEQKREVIQKAQSSIGNWDDCSAAYWKVLQECCRDA